MAAINPQDLDGLDEDCPLSKPTMECLMGRGLTPPEYLAYFTSHPDGNIFSPEFQLFVSTQTALNIPGVACYNQNKRQLLSRDIDRGDDESDDREKVLCQQAVTQFYQRQGKRSQLPQGAQPPQYGYGY